MDSENLIRKDSDDELKGIKDLQQNSPDYNPVKSEESMLEERKVRHDLQLQHVDPEIVKSIRGYRPDEIPFIYKDLPTEVMAQINRGAEPTMEKGNSELWIGSSDEIWNLYNKNGWNDQIPEVLVQWRGLTLAKDKDSKEVSRQEIKHLSGGRFIELEYRGVSEMGQFDGHLARISIYTPKETFRPYGGNERNSYEITMISRKSDVDTTGLPGGRRVIDKEDEVEWGYSGGFGNVSGTSMLNGLGELLWAHHITSLRSVKWDPDKRFRFGELPAPVKRETPLLSPSKADLVELQEDLVPQEDLGALLNDAQEIMTKLYENIKPSLGSKGLQSAGVEMELDGIGQHPEQIWVLDKYLDEASLQGRFALKLALVESLNRGDITKWVNDVFLKSEPLQNDLLTRNARHLVLWLKRSKFDYKGIQAALADTKRVLEKGKEQDPDTVDQLTFEIIRRSNEGMASSLTERYIEYLAQRYLGKYLG